MSKRAEAVKETVGQKRAGRLKEPVYPKRVG